MQYGCNAFEKSNPTSQPLSFWTEQDIYHYIQKYNVPYCSVYGEIESEISKCNSKIASYNAKIQEILAELEKEESEG